MAARSLWIAGLLTVAVGGPLPAQTWQTMTAVRQRAGEEALRLDVEYGAGSFSIRPGAPGNLERMDLRYDADRFETIREFQARKGVATVRLGVKQLHSFSIRGMREGMEGMGSLQVELSPDVPTELELQFGAVEADLELGGLHLTEVTVETGASESKIAFSEPNAVPIPRCRFKAGAASFHVEGLGNARCQKISFEGGAADVVLDFRGAREKTVEVEIQVGIGSVTLRVPESTGLSIEKRALLATVETPRMTKRDGRWVSDNWDAASRRIVVSVKAALGSVEIDWTASE